MAKSKVITGIKAFKGPCKVLAKLSSNKTISFTNMRTELGKIKAQHEKLNTERADVESRFTSTEDTIIAAKLEKLVGEGLRR